MYRFELICCLVYSGLFYLLFIPEHKKSVRITILVTLCKCEYDECALSLLPPKVQV